MKNASLGDSVVLACLFIQNCFSVSVCGEGDFVKDIFVDIFEYSPKSGFLPFST